MRETKLVALNKWRREIGISSVTAWRWAKQGKINPINICGNLYLSQTDLETFANKAKKGEYATARNLKAMKHETNNRIKGGNNDQ